MHRRQTCRGNSPVGLLVAGLAIILIATPGATLAQDGSIIGWGRNYYGQCDVAPPNTGFVAIAAGDSHSLGLRVDGTVAAWGANGYGQCDVPTSDHAFVAVAAAGNHSFGLKDDGSVVTWGQNSDGVCDVPAPNADFVAVATGSFHALGVKSDGRIVAWGRNDYGQANVPEPNSDFVAVAVGASHSVALRSDGSVVAWGYNDFGQCDVPTPNSDFVAVDARGHHSLGLKADGSLVAWGSNASGQCDVPGSSDFVAVAAGVYHDLALRSDGSVVAWGSNTYGQCNVPASDTGFVDVAAGSLHSLALHALDANAAPEIECLAPLVLWSSGHELVDASGVFSYGDPDGDPVDLVSVRAFSDEAETDGSDRHAPDFVEDAGGLWVRSERQGGGDGRCYVFVVTVSDGTAATTSACVAAVVPHDQDASSLDQVLAEAAALRDEIQDALDNDLPLPADAYELGLGASAFSQSSTSGGRKAPRSR